MEEPSCGVQQEFLSPETGNVLKDAHIILSGWGGHMVLLLSDPLRCPVLSMDIITDQVRILWPPVQFVLQSMLSR